MTTSAADLAILRCAYARQIAHAAGVDDPRIETALAELRRETFLPPPPWIVPTFGAPGATHPVDDPLYVYQDRPVTLRADRRLNNGQPSFLAMLIGLGRLREGDRAVHIGTGSGYYTAIMSRLVGQTGRVLGIEYEADLADEARRNLRSCANVTIVQGDGFAMPLDPADVIYVNAGTPRPAATWLDAMKPGGRLVMPLCIMESDQGEPATRGAIFLIERDSQGFAATWKSPTTIYPCVGASDATAEAALMQAFKSEGMQKVRRLYRTAEAPDENCWLRGADWCLAYT